MTSYTYPLQTSYRSCVVQDVYPQIAFQCYAVGTITVTGTTIVSVLYSYEISVLVVNRVKLLQSTSNKVSSEVVKFEC